MKPQYSDEYPVFVIYWLLLMLIWICVLLARATVIPDKQTSIRMIKASDATYYIESGFKSCPRYADIGFISDPEVIRVGAIDAALVGVTTTEIIVAFRGTLPFELGNWDQFVESVVDWANDAKAELVQREYSPGLVHSGFAEELDAMWGPVFNATQALRLVRDLPVCFIGHSKGGGLATLAALKYAVETAFHQVAVYTFASPMVGDNEFATYYNAVIKTHCRFENTDDIVPHLPAGDILWAMIGAFDRRLRCLKAYQYRPVGSLLFFDWSDKVTTDEQSTNWQTALNGRRDLHLGELEFSGQIEKIGRDHDLESQYLLKLNLLGNS